MFERVRSIRHAIDVHSLLKQCDTRCREADNRTCYRDRYGICRCDQLEETSFMMVSNRMMWGVLAVVAGAGLAAVLMPPARSRWLAPRNDQSNRVDEASEDSFPASDPPSFSADTGAQAVPGPTS
jgi:hypothetical protein